MNCKASVLLIATTVAVALTQSATAADLPVARPAYQTPAVVPVAPFSWSGCYVGLNVGGASDRHKYVTNNVDPLFTPAGLDAGSHTATGVIAGGQAGCDYQGGPVVVGFEGLFDWADLSRGHFVPQAGVTLGTRARWLGIATGRIGYSFDRALLYVKGGGAFINETESVTAGGVTTDDGGRTRTGWTAGVGLEYAWAPNWSSKLEYNYMDFGNKGTTTCILGVCGPTVVNDKQTLHSILLGVNYRF
jgi:outer membrane immunogenic protein